MAPPIDLTPSKRMPEEQGYSIDYHASGLQGTAIYTLTPDALHSMPPDARERFKVAEDEYTAKAFGFPHFLQIFASLEAERATNRNGVFSWKNLFGAGEPLRRQVVLDRIFGHQEVKQSKGESPVIHVLGGSPELDDLVKGNVRYSQTGGVVGTRLDYSGKLSAFGVVEPDKKFRARVEEIGFGNEAKIFRIDSRGIELLLPLGDLLGRELQDKTELAGHDLYIKLRYAFRKEGKSKFPTHLVLNSVEIASLTIDEKGMIKSGRDFKGLVFGKAGNTLGIEDETVLETSTPKHGPITQTREISVDLPMLLMPGSIKEVPSAQIAPDEVIRKIVLDNEKVFRLFGDKRLLRISAKPYALSKLVFGFGRTLEYLFQEEHQNSLQVESTVINQLREMICSIDPEISLYGPESKRGRLRLLSIFQL